MFRKRSDSYGTASSSSSKPYSVFGIHGITGSGKSTLAKYICDHERKAEDKHFDLIMFSHVSVAFRVEKIFGDMLSDITNKQSDKKDIESLGKELMEKMKGRRFLLVLDDLWVKGENQKEREILLDALSTGENGSIILVTAQTKDAASGLGAQEPIPIQDLEEEEYLKLFMHHALQGADDDYGRFERTGRTIAKKLRKSPIAAVAVGRRLQAEKSISFWETTANLDVLNETMDALWWSYQKLGVDTRRCFQYCSTFPKGYMLTRDDLVRMWIAQGFVNAAGSNETEELEDVGMRYFQELLQFSFLHWGIGEEITIHDLLHDLAEKVARSDFFRIDDSMGLLVKDILPDVRHLFIGNKNATQGAQTAEKNLDLGNLRSLIIDEPYTGTHRKERRHDLEKIFERLFMRLSKLRVLIIRVDSHFCPVEFSFPASIGQMKHLRYFSCSWRSAKNVTLILPSTFSKLYQMQTIFFSRCTSVSYPYGMGNLIRLRHIGAELDFPNVGRMTSLQTMECFFVKKEQAYELKQLEQLNKLQGRLLIVGLVNVGSKEEALEADLASKKRLTDLSLSFYGGTKGPDIEAEVLEGLCPPKDLHVLIIWWYKGSWYPSWMLSGQQHRDAPKHLRTLELIHCSSPLASFPEDSEFFMHLRELVIGEQDSLPENMEGLVSLQSLALVGCGQYSKCTMVLGPTLPRSLRKIVINGSNLVLENMEHLMSLESLKICCCDKPTLPLSLKKITIFHCDVLSRTCQEEGHANWRKIQHVPCKEIYSKARLPCEEKNCRLNN